MGRALLPAGVVAAVATAVSGWAPVAESAPEAPTRDTGLRAPAADSADGTYESCGAYFGFGKDTDGVLDVVQFDVADQNGSDGTDHAVPADTQVVLVLENAEGETLECAAAEVTEAQWDDAMADIDIYLPEGKSLPAWPGPGHYIYPSISFGPSIEDFGQITGVGFRVVSVPDGHTLVSPTATTPLDQHFFMDANSGNSYLLDPRVQAVIEAGSSAAAAADFAAALQPCEDTDEFDDFGPATVDAINALQAYRGFDPIESSDVSCFYVGRLNHDVAFLLGLDETTTYVEPIVLALPEEATTTTTTTATTIPVDPPPTAPLPATAVPGSPTYTG